MNVRDYWDLSDDDLYEVLGASLLGVGIGISPENNYRRFGKRRFARQHGELQRRICNDKRIRELTGTTVSDHLVDAAAIVETAPPVRRLRSPRSPDCCARRPEQSRHILRECQGGFLTMQSMAERAYRNLEPIKLERRKAARQR